MVDRETAGIGAAMAVGHGCRVFEFLDLLQGQHGRRPGCVIALPGNQGRAESAHDPGNIRPDDFAVRDLLKGPEDGVIVEGASLYNDIAPQLTGIRDLNDFVERIFNDGISQACGDVRDRSPFLLGLFDLGVHEHSAAGSQIDGVLRKERGFRKILYAVVQGLCEILDEGAAARGTGLIEHYVVHGVFPDADAFHVLSADIKDAVHVGIEELGRIIMGNGLHLSLIQKEGCFDQCLSVAGRTGRSDHHVLRHMGIGLLNGPDRRSERIAVVVVIEGIEQPAVLGDQCGLRRRGAGVDA